MTSNTATRGAVADPRRRVSPAPACLAERDHELRAALFAIEVTATGLSRGRDRMTSMQVDELMDGIAAEIRRVRALIDGSPEPTRTFDLAGAIAPVVACAYGAGLDVRCAVPAGIQVEGRPDSTAQVVAALLDNARQHARSSPVELHVARFGGSVVLTVEDLGPGVDASVRGRLFERGVRSAQSTGSGLGLHVARRLMREQGGDIAVRDRAGGGTTFALQFRSASPK